MLYFFSVLSSRNFQATVRLTGSLLFYVYDRAAVLLSCQYDCFCLVLCRPGYFRRCLRGGVRQAVRRARRFKRLAPPSSIAAFAAAIALRRVYAA